jgi:hypothetical protein
MSQYLIGNAKVASLAPPNTPPAFVVGGAGNVDVGDHRVAMTFVNAFGGETLCGADVLITISTSAKTVTLDDAPLGPAGTTKRKFYASKIGNPSGPKFLIGELSDNTTTDGFVYNVADSALGVQAPTTNKYGTAAVELTNGGITGSWAGKLFKFQGESAWFQIASVQDDKHFALSSGYTGLKALDTALPYLVGVDFTANLGLPELSPGDVDIRDVFTRLARQVDSLLAGHRLFAGYTEYILGFGGTTRVLTLRGGPDQTGNIFECLKEDGTVGFAVQANGTTTQTISVAVFDQVKTQTLLSGAQRNMAKWTLSGGNDFLDVGDTAGWFATRIFGGIPGAAIYVGNHTPVATPFTVVGIGLGSSPSPSGLDPLYVKNATAGGLSGGRAMTIETDENTTSSIALLRLSRLDNTVGRSGGIGWFLQDDQPARVEYAYTAAKIRNATSAGSLQAGDWIVGLLDAGVSRRIRLTVTNAGIGIGVGSGNQAPTNPTHALHLSGALGAATQIKFESGGNSASIGASLTGAAKIGMFDSAGVEKIIFDVSGGGTALVTTGLAVSGAGVNVATIASTNVAATRAEPLYLDRVDNIVTHEVGLAFRMNNSAPTLVALGQVAARLRTNTAGAEEGDLLLSVKKAAGLAEVVRLNALGRVLVNTSTDDAAGTAAAVTIKAWSAAAHGLRVVNFTSQTPMIELGSSGSDVGVVAVYDGSAVEQSRISGGGNSWILGEVGFGPQSGNLTPKTGASGGTSFFYAGSTGVAGDFEIDSTSGTTFAGVQITRYDSTVGHQIGVSLRLLDGGSARQEYAYVAGRIRTATAGAEEGDVVLSATRAGARTELARLMGSTGALAIGTGGDASAMVHVLKSQAADTFVRVDNAFNASSTVARTGFQGQMWDGSATNPAFTIARNADGLFSLVNHSIKAGATDSRALEIEQAGAFPIRLKMNAANGQALEFGSVTELLTIAAAETTTSSIQIPADSVALGVSSYVETAIPTAATFDVGIAGGGANQNLFSDDVSTTLGSSDRGTDAGPKTFTTATSIVITPNLTPAAATGKVRLTIHYYRIVPASS